MPSILACCLLLAVSNALQPNLRTTWFPGSAHEVNYEVNHDELALEVERAFPFRGGFFSRSQPFNDTNRGKYINGKLHTDAEVLASLPSTHVAETGGEGEAPKKVAFLFMLMDVLNQPEVWDKFFEGAEPERFSIYTHAALTPEASESPTPLDKWGGQAINWVKSSWCALLGVEVALIDAALKDPHNAQLVFVSHDAVPVKSFQYIHKQLVVRSPTTSKFCFAEPAKHERALVEQLTNQIHSQCIYRDFYRTHQPRTLKHHEWVILSRSHAAIIGHRARDGHRIWADSWKLAAPDLPTGDGCSDESVPATALLYDAELRGESAGNTWADLDGMGVEQQCLTFVHWYHCLTHTPFNNPNPNGWVRSVRERTSEVWRYFFDSKFDLLRDTTLNDFPTNYVNIDAEQIKELTRHGFMFARKFPPDALVVSGHGVSATSVHLSAYLPTLWDEVDEESARNRVWTRMETVGQPGYVADGETVWLSAG